MSYSPTKLISIKAPWRCLGSAEFLVQEAFVGSAKGSKNADIAETKNPGKQSAPLRAAGNAVLELRKGLSDIEAETFAQKALAWVEQAHNACCGAKVA